MSDSNNDGWTVVSYKQKKPLKVVPKEGPVGSGLKPYSKSAPTQPTKTNVISQKTNKSESQRLAKIENEQETFHVKRVPMNIARDLTGKRLAKGWNQEELAQKCNLQLKVVKEVENGTGVYDGKIIDKLKRVLG